MKEFITYYDSPVGQLKIVCTDEHLTAVLFCNEKVEAIPDRHPLLMACITQLDDYFTGNRNSFTLPLSQAGTAFQQKVWKLLQEIPFGKTISYQQMASRYGDLKAIRAVASANGKNKLSIVVPCHRVIGSNQSLTGYAGGLWRKKWLLDHESKFGAGIHQMGLLFE